MRFLILNITLFITFQLSAQLESIEKIDTVNVVRKSIAFKTLSLYDSTDQNISESIGRFKALTIFDNELGSQFWASEEPNCIHYKSLKNNQNNLELAVNWDKISGGCKWIGIGFGWDFWQPKDLSDIIDSANVVIYVSTSNDTLNHLPLAFAFEDYSGKQCFAGFNKSFINSKIIPGKWSKVKIPLRKFPFETTKVNPDQIKQFIIQFEAEGSLIIDKIRLERTNTI